MKKTFTDLDTSPVVCYGVIMNDQRELALAQLEAANESSSISTQANAIAAARVRALIYLADMLGALNTPKE